MDKYSLFIKKLKSKEESFEFLFDLIKEKQSIKDIHFDFFIPAMKDLTRWRDSNDISKWEEKLKVSNLKALVEYSYYYILNQKHGTVNKKVLIALPEGEYDEIGALIANNIFKLSGFNTIYAGFDLKNSEIMQLLDKFEPGYFTIGLRNYYNSIETYNLFNDIKSKYKSIKLIVGGPVFNKKSVENKIKYDYFIRNYDEIFNIAKEVKL